MKSCFVGLVISLVGDLILSIRASVLNLSVTFFCSVSLVLNSILMTTLSTKKGTSSRFGFGMIDHSKRPFYALKASKRNSSSPLFSVEGKNQSTYLLP